MADTKSRPGRSNSLQRMLDLEKQYMVERLRPQTNQPNSKCQTTSAFGTNHQASPESIHARRTEGHAQKSHQSSGDHRRYTSLPPQLPPLMINTDLSHTMSRSDLLMDRGRQLPSQNGPKSATATLNEKYKKVVAFDFPPKEVAQCQSPSWEAYERRKNEKKMEKKEREESKKDGIKRLSKKPPPPSSPRSLQQALAAEADAGRGRGRERAETTAAVGGLSKENKPARKARSRSGSFVSMLRAPFEFRRSYTDQGNDLGFIGGIKLELQRHAAQQQDLDGHAVEDESNIHPALRKGNQEPKSNTPLKSPPPPPRPGGVGETDQRRYPPITRGNNYHQKTASLVSPSAPAIPDISTIGEWRTKVDLKAGSRPQSRAGHDEESQLSGDDSNGRKQQSNLPRAARGPREQPKSPSSSSSKPVHIAFAASPSTSSPPSAQTEPEKQPEHRRPQYYSNNESVLSNSSATTGYKTAPSSPPPEPPRRSSKRLSALSLDEAIPPVPPLTLHQIHGSQQLSVNDVQSSGQRSFPLLKNTAKPQGTQPKDDGNEKATSSSCQMSPYLLSPGHNGHLPTCSSEDSCSEDFHSASSVSTPATSRPGSERGMPLISKDEAATPDPNAFRARFTTTYPLQSADNSEDEGVDPIQAAAEKVLAVFNEIPVQRSDFCRRRNSLSSLATDTSFEPSARERPLNLRSSRKKATEPSQNGYSPGSYLQEARSQPPAAAPTRVHKQRFGPPASFVLPDQDSSENDNLKPALAVPDIVSRHLRHKSTTHLATTDQDPIAKTFVECCSCKYYHDMPYNLYQVMSNPEGALSSADKCGFVGALSMTVRCSWCKHEMSVRCCAAFSTMVYIQERLH